MGNENQRKRPENPGKIAKRGSSPCVQSHVDSKPPIWYNSHRSVVSAEASGKAPASAGASPRVAGRARTALDKVYAGAASRRSTLARLRKAQEGFKGPDRIGGLAPISSRGGPTDGKSPPKRPHAGSTPAHGSTTGKDDSALAGWRGFQPGNKTSGRTSSERWPSSRRQRS